MDELDVTMRSVFIGILSLLMTRDQGHLESLYDKDMPEHIRESLPMLLNVLATEGFITSADETGRLTQKGLDFFVTLVMEEFGEDDPDDPMDPGFAFELAFDFFNLTCTRRLAVPCDYTFYDLHQSIQTCMNWMDYHAWDFEVEIDGKRCSIKLPEDETPLSNDFMIFGAAHGQGEVMSAVDTYLEDVFPEATGARYSYDYGDGWEIVVRLIGEGELLYGVPRCLEGTGDAPPEDVGGEPGFEDFLELMAGPECEERTEMAEWAQEQGYRPFDLMLTNERLAAMHIASFGVDDEEDLDEIARDNSECIDVFGMWLRATGIRQATINRHAAAVEAFLNDFCLYEKGVVMEDAALVLADYFGDEGMSQGRWTSRTQIKNHAASIKKFYQCMSTINVVDAEIYQEVSSAITKGLPGWMKAFDQQRSRKRR